MCCRRESRFWFSWLILVKVLIREFRLRDLNEGFWQVLARIDCLESISYIFLRRIWFSCWIELDFISVQEEDFLWLFGFKRGFGGYVSTLDFIVRSFIRCWTCSLIISTSLDF